MNNQEVFNKVVTHLRKQGRKSSMLAYEGCRPRYLCAYRGDVGAKCAIGCLIDDEHYRPEMEAKPVYDSLVWAALEASLGTEVEKTNRLFMFLQRVHDGVPIKDWEREFAEAARVWNLELPEKEEVEGDCDE